MFYALGRLLEDIMKIPRNLSGWRARMQKHPRGRQILANIAAEENVPESVSRAVFSELQLHDESKRDPVQSLLSTLDGVVKSALSGPKAHIGEMDLLTHFTSLSHIADQAEARRRGYTETKFIAKPNLLDKLPTIRVGYRGRNIVWAAAEKPVGNDLAAGAPVDLVLDRLGMPVPLAPMVQITYNVVDVPPPIKVPTAFDAGGLSEFRPAPKGAGSGMTRPVSGKGHGYPEFVHRGCDISDPGLRLHFVRGKK
jgi:hypothetical protein